MLTKFPMMVVTAMHALQIITSWYNGDVGTAGIMFGYTISDIALITMMV